MPIPCSIHCYLKKSIGCHIELGIIWILIIVPTYCGKATKGLLCGPMSYLWEPAILENSINYCIWTIFLKCYVFLNSPSICMYCNHWCRKYLHISVRNSFFWMPNTCWSFILEQDHLLLSPTWELRYCELRCYSLYFLFPTLASS